MSVLLHVQEGTVAIEFVAAGLEVADVETAGIHDDAAGGVHGDVRAVHGPWSRAFEIDALAVVAAAVAGAFEFVFAGLPVGGAAEMGAARVDDKEALGIAHDPDAKVLLELGVHAEGEVGGIANGKDGGGLEEDAREEKPEEHEEIDAQIAPDAGPDDAAADVHGLIGYFFVGFRGSGRLCGGRRSARRWCLAVCWLALVLCGHGRRLKPNCQDAGPPYVRGESYQRSEKRFA